MVRIDSRGVSIVNLRFRYFTYIIYFLNSEMLLMSRRCKIVDNNVPSNSVGRFGEVDNQIACYVAIMNISLVLSLSGIASLFVV